MASLSRMLDRMNRSANRAIVPRLLMARCDRASFNPSAMRHVAVFPGLRIAYNRIKKNANSTTMVLLRELDSGRAEHERAAKLNSLHLEKMPVWLARRIPDWTFVTIIRNPHSRLVSVFFNKFEKEAYRRRYGDFELSPTGFRRFVYWLRDGAIAEDPHWDLQTKLLLMPLGSFDRVIRFEQLAVDLTRFLRDRGIVAGTGIPRTSPRGDARLAECCTPEIAGIVARLYERDFEELRYPSRLVA